MKELFQVLIVTVATALTYIGAMEADQGNILFGTIVSVFGLMGFVWVIVIDEVKRRSACTPFDS